MGIAWRGISVRGLAWDKSDMYNIWTASVSWSDVRICFFYMASLLLSDAMSDHLQVVICQEQKTFTSCSSPMEAIL